MELVARSFGDRPVLDIVCFPMTACGMCTEPKLFTCFYRFFQELSFKVEFERRKTQSD